MYGFDFMGGLSDASGGIGSKMQKVALYFTAGNDDMDRISGPIAGIR